MAWQLCINHTNEKLQNFFLRSVFKAEEIAYKNDGIKWEPIPYTDNANIIDARRNAARTTASGPDE